MNECRDLARKAIYKPFNKWGITHILWQNLRLGQAMWRFIKALLFLIILAGVGLVAYAYIGPLFFPADFAPPSQEVTRPVTLETN